MAAPLTTRPLAFPTRGLPSAAAARQMLLEAIKQCATDSEAPGCLTRDLIGLAPDSQAGPPQPEAHCYFDMPIQHEELKACVDEYAMVDIWELEHSAAGEPVVTFSEACRPWTS